MYEFTYTGINSVSISNEMRIGSAAGYEDWLLELVLVHEYRHLVQHDEAWRRIAANKGLEPDQCPLKRAVGRKKGCPDFEPVAKAYQEWNDTPWRHVLLELDAYHFAYDYFEKFLEPELDPARKAVFLNFLQERMMLYSEKIAAYETLYVRTDEVDWVRGILSRHAELLTGLQVKITELNRVDIAMGIAVNGLAHAKTAGGELKHSDGTPFSLRERLVFLQGAVSYLDEHFDAWERAGRDHLGNIRVLGAGAALAMRMKELDALLNRQTLAYHHQVWSPYAHRVAYRNDDWHTNDGAIRNQDFYELDFDTEGDGKIEAKVGEDLSLSIPWGAKAFFKIAPMLYVGVNSEHGFNPILGTRLDLRLHYDLDWGQTWGTSVSVGYAVGAHLGFGGLFDGEFDPYSDAYDKADVSLEVFRF